MTNSFRPAVILAVLLSAAVHAEEVWEYSPYRVHIWLAFEESPELPPVLCEQIRRDTADQVKNALGPAWDVRDVVDLRSDRGRELEAQAVKALSSAGVHWRRRHAPPEVVKHAAAALEQAGVPDPLEVIDPWKSLAEDMLASLEGVTIERVQGMTDDVVKDDKLFLATVVPAVNGFHIRAREFDAWGRVWSRIVERDCMQQERLAVDLSGAIVESFTPIVRLESQKTMEARVKAGGLIGPDSPAAVRPGDFMQVSIRKGNPRGGVAVASLVQWTLLEVESTKANGVLVECRVHTGVPRALGTRTGRRTQKIGLVVRPQGTKTTIIVQSAGKDPQPLPGYDIYTHDAETVESHFLASTDWRGQYEIESKGKPQVQMLYIKNGSVLLARLPVLPGLEPTAIAEVRDDDLRLRAERAVRGLQYDAMDIVARRQLLAARARSRIEKGLYDDAGKVIEELQTLENWQKIQLQFATRKNDFDSADPKSFEKIEMMFAVSSDALSTYFDPALPSKLSSELAQARAQGSP